MQKNIHIEFGNPLGIFNLDDFSYLYEDIELKRIAENASLYFILQRPCLIFRNLIYTSKLIKGKIVQPYTENYIEFELPLYQKDVIESDKIMNIELHLCYNKSLKDENNLNNFIDVIIIKIPEEKNFTKLLTPDSILQKYSNKTWQVNLNGEINKFLEFDIKYIGHSVKQFIGNRIKSHSNIQRILTTTQPYQKGMQISKELCICLLEISDIHEVKIISPSDSLENENLFKLPNNESIYYDAEKAFINFFSKSSKVKLENKDVYNSYPKGRNGLFDEKYENIIYSIKDDIIFKYGDQQLNNQNVIYVDRKLKTVEKK
ncbi:hypothetical protein [Flavobacterium sp. LB2P6]|uniref:hypothetical protein n=1 Tax=Flavobacterium sp. LB2P6 TaxID=3401714 RepID=UPI003AAD23F1